MRAIGWPPLRAPRRGPWETIPRIRPNPTMIDRATILLLAALATLCAGAAIPATAQAPSPTTSPSALIETARQALEAKRPEEAIEPLRRALAAQQGQEGEGAGARARRAEIHALLGRALALTDDYAEAADALALAVEEGRSDLGTLLFLGSAQWESQRFEPAVETLGRAAERSAGTPSEFLANHQLGRLLLFLGRPGEALPALERAVELRPDAFDARLDLARALDRSGATERAVEAYRGLVETAPQSPHARWGLGQALLRVGDREEAARQLAAYQELYEADQKRTRDEILFDARLARARELFEGGDPAAARAIVEELPETPLTLEALGRIRAAQGDYAGAVDALRRAVTLAPDRDDLRGLLAQARLLAREGDDGR